MTAIEGKVTCPDCGRGWSTPAPDECPRCHADLTEAAVEALPFDGEEAAPDYSSLTYSQLRAELRARGLRVKGSKAELVGRLEESDAPAFS